MRNRRRMAAAVAGFMLAAVVAGCGQSSEQGVGGSGQTAGAGDLAGKKVAFLTLTPTCEPCAQITKGVEDTLKAKGIEVTTTSSDFDGAAEQIQQFNQALSRQPDAVIIWPTNTTSIIPALKQAKQTNPDIPIITTIYKPETDESLWGAYVGTDDVELGSQAARSLIEGIKGAGLSMDGSVIAVEGAPGAATTIGRQKGFDQALAKEAPGLKLVGTQPGNWDQTEATSAAAALFSKYAGDKIVGVYAHSDIMLAGALVAAKRATLTPGKDFIAVAIDCTVEGYNNVKDGDQYATQLLDAPLEGRETAEVTMKVMSGDQVNKNNIVETPAITAKNLQDCAKAVGQ